MAENINKNEITEAFYKSAIGFSSSEVVEEYATDDKGELKLIKRKVRKKEVPPNINALKVLAEISLKESDFSELSDEQLEIEKLKYISLLKEEQKEELSYEKDEF